MLTDPEGTASIKARPGGPGPSTGWTLGASILGCVLGLAGCATAPMSPARVVPPAARAASFEEVLAAYEGYCRSIETLSASGDLDVRDLRDQKTQTLSFRLVAERGGRLYLKGSVALVTALEVVADGRHFWFQVPRKKTVWTGPAAGAPARDPGQPAYYALRPQDLTTALIPEPFQPQEGDALVLEANPHVFSLTLSRISGGRGTARRCVWLDRQTLHPIRLLTFDDRGDLTLEVSLGQWDRGIPHRVALSRPEDGYEASFDLSKVEVNVAVPDRVFVPRTPPEYTVVEVHD